jgi:hypothetical protein
MPSMHRAHLHSRLPGRSSEHRIRMGHPKMSEPSRRSRAGLHSSMPRARRMRHRPRASISGRRTSLPSDARAAFDAPVLRSAHQAQSLLSLVEYSDQFLCISDQVIAARTVDALNFVLFDVNQHRVRAAFRTDQHVIVRVKPPSPYPSKDPISEFTQLGKL